MEYKTCAYCEISKNIDQFYSHDNKCKSCRSILAKMHYATNKEKIQQRRKLNSSAICKSRSDYYVRNKMKIDEHNKQYYKNNKEKVYASIKERYFKNKYNLTLEQYNYLVAAQDGKCAICVKWPISGKKILYVDHDHKTGKVRGLLCCRCNLVLGAMEDDPALLQAAISYLTKEA